MPRCRLCQACVWSCWRRGALRWQPPHDKKFRRVQQSILWDCVSFHVREPLCVQGKEDTEVLLCREPVHLRLDILRKRANLSSEGSLCTLLWTLTTLMCVCVRGYRGGGDSEWASEWAKKHALIDLAYANRVDCWPRPPPPHTHTHTGTWSTHSLCHGGLCTCLHRCEWW